MALSATTHWEVRNAGSDSVCSGGFDPGQTAGMNTDGAATLATSTAPVFTSASYSFVAGDVGAWVFIGAGTNWIAGWYKIASVAGGAATLNATHEQYSLYPCGVSAFDGCATVASPTGATWSIDYSQQSARRFAYTDLASSGAGLTASSAAFPFSKEQVGNAIYVTAGTNWTAGVYVLASVAAGVGTFLGAANMTTGAGASGVGSMGGAFASVGMVGAYHVAGNSIWLPYNATASAVGSTTSNVSTGRITLAAGTSTLHTLIRGYDVARGDETSNRPSIKWGINSVGFNAITTGLASDLENIIVDGDRATGSNNNAGISFGSTGSARRIKVMNCKAAPITVNGVVSITGLELSNNATAFSFGTTTLFLKDSYIHDNITNVALTGSSGTLICDNVIFNSNAVGGVSLTASAFFQFNNCVFYGNGYGVLVSSNVYDGRFRNCIFDSQTGYGIQLSGSYAGISTTNCAYYNNTSGQIGASVPLNWRNKGAITLSASPFVNPASGDFRLNSNAGGGALLKSAGYPSTFPGLTWASNIPIGLTVNKAGSAGGGGYFSPF